MKHDHEGDIVENELLEEFPELLDEVSRDNVVTENEKELLIERANELGLPVEKIDHLQNKRFIGY
ncbi:MAG: hypothetical protein U5K72_17695 [Balneolaceae bacterium]|nr:hypothetical protein [Balneolaceae bacterium]